MAPERVGDYELIEPLGKGGNAEVFLARRLSTGEVCVLKRLRAEKNTNPNEIRRFDREAELATFLDHPNIARIFESVFDGPVRSIAMEYIAGQPVLEILKRLLEDGRLVPYRVSVAIVLGALDALAYAHDLTGPEGRPLELVHRDLSPRNIMLSYRGVVKVIDFGIARAELGDFRTTPGTVLGTVRYMSPEQALGLPADRRADLYTLGVLLYELLGGAPCVGRHEGVEVLRAIAFELPAPLLTVNPDVPRRLVPVVMRALEKTPDRRFQTAREMQAVLSSAAGGELVADTAELASFMRSTFREEAERAERQLEEIERPTAPALEAIDDGATMDATGERVATAPLVLARSIAETPTQMIADKSALTELATPPAPARARLEPPEGARAFVTAPLSGSTLRRPDLRRAAGLALGAALVAGAYAVGRLQGGKQDEAGAVRAPPVEAAEPRAIARPQPVAPEPEPAGAVRAPPVEAAEPRAIARPQPVAPEPEPAEPRVEDREPARVPELKSEKAAAARRPGTKRTAASEPVRAPQETAEKTRATGLEPLLAELRAAPADRGRFLALCDAIRAAAADLPEADRAGVLARASRASLTFDLDELEAAHDELKKRRSR